MTRYAFFMLLTFDIIWILHLYFTGQPIREPLERNPWTVWYTILCIQLPLIYLLAWKLIIRYFILGTFEFGIDSTRWYKLRIKPKKLDMNRVYSQGIGMAMYLINWFLFIVASLFIARDILNLF